MRYSHETTNAYGVTHRHYVGRDVGQCEIKATYSPDTREVRLSSLPRGAGQGWWAGPNMRQARRLALRVARAEGVELIGRATSAVVSPGAYFVFLSR